MKIISFIAILGLSSALASVPSSNGKFSHLKVDKTQVRSERYGLNMQASSTIATPLPKKKGGEASISTSTFNLAKSIIGAGVLSLPNGVAVFSNEPKAMIPAAILTTVMGLLAAYTFSLIGQAVESTEADSFSDAWAKSVDPNSAW